MTNNWAIEAHDTKGGKFLFRPVVTDEEAENLVSEVLRGEHTGGVVIYRSVPSNAQIRVRMKGGDAATAGGPGEPGYVIIEPVMPDCETEEEENLGKVALGNEEESSVPSALSAYERGEHPCPPLGGCKECGCPPEDMPMINRRTGWCSENCHKQQLARSNNVE